MKMIVRLLFLSLIFSALISSAQTQKVMLSPSEIDEPSYGYIKVIGQDDSGYFVLMSNITLNYFGDRKGFRSRKYKLAYYSSGLTPVWSKPLTATNDNADIDNVSFFNGSILMVSSAYDKQQQSVSYYFSKIDNQGTISNIEKPAFIFSGIQSDYEKSRVIISGNQTRVAIVAREYTTENNQTIAVAVFDENLQFIHSSKGNINFADKNFEITGYQLSNTGDFGMLGIHSEKIKALSSKRKTDYLIYVAAAGASAIKELPVSSVNPITGMGIAFDNVNRKLVVAGFYADLSAPTGSGVVYGSVGMEDSSALSIRSNPIDNQKNIRLKGERNAASGMSLIGYPIERIVVRNDGGAVIVAEAAYTTEYSYYDYFTQSFTRREEFHFDNVVVISVNSDATIHWSAIAEKQQVSIDDDGAFSSFCALLNSEQFIMLFNDDISRQNSIIPVTVSNTGSSVRGKPVPGGDGLLLIPRSAKQVSENEILAPVYRKRKLFLARFSF